MGIRCERLTQQEVQDLENSDNDSDRYTCKMCKPPLLAHTSSESRGTFRQKARSLAPLNGWACAVKICHDGMLEDTNSLDGAQLTMPQYLYGR